MLSLLSSVANLIDIVLLKPITSTIETLLAAIYYFFAGSCFVGYWLVQGGAHIWSFLCYGFQLAATIFKDFTIFYSNLRHIVCDISDYIYDGTGDALILARNVFKGIFLFLADVLIGIGNCTLWIVLLLPRFIIVILDYLILALHYVAACIVEHGTYLLNNIFRLSIGIVLLLVLYVFRGYVYYYAVYLLRKLRYEMSTKVYGALQSASRWIDQQLSWVMQKFEISERTENASPNRIICVVCLDRSRNIVMLPCRHLCVCKECSLRLERLEDERRCPVCRHSVDALMVVYD
ncbi:uncharacterized protein LOC6562288 [Drosophila grimshawi]|uniref:GH10878 n=1 Tax=Drosophila grimshawi TaxID=7222 RepID=B4JAJ2_DROGR|nr:uncharacterized protein LOC6562288 [Drosophila grimshawi]EDW02778.1 GH10878 [Drosophila grimshawi]